MIEEMSGLYRQLLTHLGEDPDREGLLIRLSALPKPCSS